VEWVLFLVAGQHVQIALSLALSAKPKTMKFYAFSPAPAGGLLRRILPPSIPSTPLRQRYVHGLKIASSLIVVFK